MEEEILRRYLLNQTSQEEEIAVVEWLDADPEHQKIYSEVCKKIETLLWLELQVEDMHTKRKNTVATHKRIVRWVAEAAAAVLLCVGTIYLTATHVRHELTCQEQTLATENAPLRYKLTDGTTVWLNAHTTLVYPMAFTGRERTVRITGEAMFDVVHDERLPFVVETAACNIRVLGTKFNVLADAAGEVFETALLRGQVEILNRATGEQVTLAADESVTLRSGTFVRRQIAEVDDYLWTDGFINLKGHTFDELIVKFSQVFDVKIETKDLNVPDTKFWWGKIRVRDGVDNAMKALHSAFTISYEFDRERNMITVCNK